MGIGFKKLLYGYRRRPHSGGVSPFHLMYGVPPRVDTKEAVALLPHSSLAHRTQEILSTPAIRAERLLDQERKAQTNFEKLAHRFVVGEQLLVARGDALNLSVKWPLCKFKYFGPCTIVRPNHPRYELVSPNGRVSRQAIRARRLMPYFKRPTHLS